jgi:hypothetical protein
MSWPCLPGAHESQLLPILFEHRIIRNPGPLPAAARRLACAGGVTSQRFQYLHTQASEPLEPGAFGQGPEQTGGQVLVPTSHTTQFRMGAAPEQRGTHHPDDFPQELVLAVQAPFDLGREVFRKSKVIEGLLEGLSSLLRLPSVSLKTLLSVEAATLSGFRVFCGVSLRGRHAALLRFVWVCGGGSLLKRTRHTPPHSDESRITAASPAPRTSGFLLLTMYGIHTPKRPCQCPRRLPHTASA